MKEQEGRDGPVLFRDCPGCLQMCGKSRQRGRLGRTLAFMQRSCMLSCYGYGLKASKLGRMCPWDISEELLHHESSRCRRVKRGGKGEKKGNLSTQLPSLIKSLLGSLKTDLQKLPPFSFAVCKVHITRPSTEYPTCKHVCLPRRLPLSLSPVSCADMSPSSVPAWFSPTDLLFIPGSLQHIIFFPHSSQGFLEIKVNQWWSLPAHNSPQVSPGPSFRAACPSASLPTTLQPSFCPLHR